MRPGDAPLRRSTPVEPLRGDRLGPKHGESAPDEGGGIGELEAAQLLCSRLCHDLVGPVGAVAAGLELLADGEGDRDTEAFDLVVSSARQLSSRLAYLRCVFGSGGGADGTMRLDDARGLAASLLADGSVTLDWNVEGAGADQGGGLYPIALCRLLLCLVLVASGTLMRGGTVTVAVGEGERGGLRLSVQAAGPDVRFDRTLSAAMNPSTGSGGLGAQTIHGFIAARLAHSLDASIEITVTGDRRVHFRALVPRARLS